MNMIENICKKAIEIFEDEELYELLKELGG